MSDSTESSLSSALSSLLSDPTLMSRISDIVGSVRTDEGDGDGQSPSSAALTSSLPKVMEAIAPMLGDMGRPSEPKPHPPRDCDRRAALLVALKPYLSPRRCQVIDHLIKLNSLGDVLHHIT